MKVLLPIVTVPIRDAVPGFAATVNVTVPGPDPAAPVVTVIQVALLTAVHAHPTEPLTVTVTEPPVPDSDCPDGAIVGGHGKLKPKVFERALGAAPPGPTALTTVS